MSKARLSEASLALAQSPDLAKSFESDPGRTLEKMGFRDLEPAEVKTLSALSARDFEALGAMMRKVQAVDPGFLERTWGVLIY